MLVSDEDYPHGTGRPPKYKNGVMPEQAEKLCRLGATNKDLADFFGVVERTIVEWLNKHPDFRECVKRGKDYFDTERVEKALAHRAIGYSHEETHVSNYQGEITKTSITKYYPPDTTAAIFWLKNRDPKRWRDKVEHDHGIQEDNPIMDLLAGVAGRTLKPKSDD